jgi:hypothetical protein
MKDPFFGALGGVVLYCVAVLLAQFELALPNYIFCLFFIVCTFAVYATFFPRLGLVFIVFICFLLLFLLWY